MLDASSRAAVPLADCFPPPQPASITASKTAPLRVAWKMPHAGIIPVSRAFPVGHGLPCLIRVIRGVSRRHFRSLAS